MWWIHKRRSKSNGQCDRKKRTILQSNKQRLLKRKEWSTESNVQGRWATSNYIYYNNSRLNGTLDGNMSLKKKWKKLKAKETGQRCLQKKRMPKYQKRRGQHHTWRVQVNTEEATTSRFWSRWKQNLSSHRLQTSKNFLRNYFGCRLVFFGSYLQDKNGSI